MSRPAIMITPRNSASEPRPTRIIDRPSRAAAERARQAQHGRDGEDRHRDRRPAAPSRGGRVAPSRIAAIGAMRVARRAGERLAMSVTMVPSDKRDDDCAGLDHRRGVRQVDAEQLEQPVQALCERQAEHQADDGGEHADRQPLGQHRALHLPSRGAQRAQGREFADALGERDRQRVEDHERAHAQRDERRTPAGTSG